MLEYLFFTMGSDSSEPKSKKDDGDSNLPITSLRVICLRIVKIAVALLLGFFFLVQVAYTAKSVVPSVASKLGSLIETLRQHL